MSGQLSTASILGRNLEENADPADSVNGHTYVEIDCYSMGETNRAASRAILSRRCQVNAAPCEGPTQNDHGIYIQGSALQQAIYS